MAILLGLLMRDNKANQKVLLLALPGHANYNKLVSLADQAREFITFYAELAGRLAAPAVGKTKDAEANDDISIPHSDKQNMERIVGDGNGHVAREVILFLENLAVQQS
jgi:hypothetical protein